MDINPHSAFADLMTEARRRVDGLAMYLSMVIFIIGGVLLTGNNLIHDQISFGAWKAPVASFLMIPIVVLSYFRLATFSTEDSVINRWINAFCLIGIPVYFYFKLL